MSGLRWKVEDGCLALPAGEGADTRGQRDIITKQQFDDFELSWDWRIAKGGNSGVKYFVTEKHDAAIGHEYQVIDGAHADAALREGRRQTAAFYDVLAAPGASPRPAPSFNTGRVLVKGNHVEHWLNGTKVLEYELDTDALRARSPTASSRTSPISTSTSAGTCSCRTTAMRCAIGTSKCGRSDGRRSQTTGQPSDFLVCVSPAGADVVVRSLNRRGRVMDVRGDVYHVLVGSMALRCREHELRDAGEPKPSTRRRGRKAPASPGGTFRARQFRPARGALDRPARSDRRGGSHGGSPTS